VVETSNLLFPRHLACQPSIFQLIKFSISRLGLLVFFIRTARSHKQPPMFFLHCKGCCRPSAIGATAIGLTAAFPLNGTFPSCFSNQFLRCLGCSSNRRKLSPALRYLQTSFDAKTPRSATSIPQPHNQQIIMNVDDNQQPCPTTLLDPSNPAKQRREIFPRQANERRSSRVSLSKKATKS